MACGVDHRHDSDPVLLWLWCRPAAVAQIRPLAWEPPYATSVGPKKQKREKKEVRNSLGEHGSKHQGKTAYLMMEIYDLPCLGKGRAAQRRYRESSAILPRGWKAV